MSVCGKALKISVIISSGDAHLIGVITSNRRGSANSTQVAMSEGNNACSGTASEMRGRAFMVEVIGGPAVPTAPVIGAVASLVS